MTNKRYAVREWRLYWMRMTVISLIEGGCYGMKMTVIVLSEGDYNWMKTTVGNWRQFLFGNSGDASSGLVTQETLGLVSITREVYVWFDTLRWCQRFRDDNFKTLSGFNYSGDVVWFDPHGRCGVPVISIGRPNQILNCLSQHIIVT